MKNRNYNAFRLYHASLLIGLMFSCFLGTVCNAQDKTQPMATIGLSADSLSRLTYEQIMELEDEAYEKNELNRLRKLTDIHVHKAKSESNPLEMAFAYYYRTMIEEPKLAISYADSIILVTADSKHPKYPTLGYLLKAMIYYEIGDYRLALHNYIVAYDLAVEKKNFDDQLSSSMAIAAIRNLNGQSHVAADIYTRSLHLLKGEEDYKSRYYEDYMILMYNLSLAHLRLSQLDSSRLYLNKGIETAIIKNDTIEHRDMVLVGAQLDYYEHNYKNAKDTLLKYTNQLEGNSKAMKLYYLGKIAQKSDDDLLAISYYKQIDSIIKETKEPFEKVKEVYQQLAIHYSLQDDQEQEIESLEKLIFHDSLMAIEQKGVIQQATMAYDIPYLKLQKKKAEELLKVKSNWILILGFMATLGMLVGPYFYVKAHRTKKKVKMLMEGSKQLKSPPRKVGEHPASVPKEIRNELLMKLEAFEKSDLYLRKDLDMTLLAQEMDTNTSYLSIIINHYKQMNFPKYINDLKISTAIEELTKKPALLKYNYQGLAETFGFKTGESFSKAFHKKTGVYPSKLLKELDKREKAKHS
ncbi:AraC family transcriptional regulator [Arenibacter sp. 6A1]|uniref:helix-turn-helix domain-containing protein n=1 Tax=Arenibacter sp. 6A1 TaxID=2720391 RepID=UPI00144605BD|nr:helix-turn-helix domain-containing protein [Arenibacter sp. 6A1]NKI27419.1 AraC family transcriptional regulator [Arenibacter sp. 6A1]